LSRAFSHVFALGRPRLLREGGGRAHDESGDDDRRLDHAASPIDAGQGDDRFALSGHLIAVTTSSSNPDR
jgi:hypothetical protein